MEEKELTVLASGDGGEAAKAVVATMEAMDKTPQRDTAVFIEHDPDSSLCKPADIKLVTTDRTGEKVESVSILKDATLVEMGSTIDKKKIASQEELDGMKPEEKLQVLRDYSEIIDIAAKQSTTNREIKQAWDQRDELVKFVKAPEQNPDEEVIEIDPIAILDNNMKQVANADDLLKNWLPFPEKVKELLRDPETGIVLDMDIPDDVEEHRAKEFTRDFLLFYKRCDDAIVEYEKISRESEEELKAINADLDQVTRVMSNNVLTFVESLKETIKEDSKDYKEAQATISGVESAYDFHLVFQTLEKYPSIIGNTLQDFKRESRITEVGKRYAANLKKVNCGINLITFLPRSEKMKSIEENVVPKFMKPGYKDLLIFIFIRFFSTNGALETIEGKKFHAALYHMLYQLTSNQMDDANQDFVIEHIKALLQLHYDQIRE